MLTAVLPLATLAERLAQERGASRLLGECRAAIAREDGPWRAMLSQNPGAIAQAAACDAASGMLGPLHGAPLVLKDNIDVAGMATTSGCRALAAAMPRREAHVVTRLRGAGAVLLGKTNLSEFSFEIRSRSSLGGDVVCPFAAHATAGGSSGGSAVAVALGYAAAALGTDTGGSIRVPCALNGLVGLRPTHGLLPLAGIAPLAPPTDTVGPMARRIEDARVLFEVLSGAALGPARPQRVGVLRQAFGEDAAIGSAMERSIAALAAAGVAVIDPVAIPELAGMLAGTHIVDVAFAASFDAYLQDNFQPGTAPASLAEILASEEFLPEYGDVLRRRLAADPHDVPAVMARHATLRKALEELFAHHALDALLYPTLQALPETLANPGGAWAAELAARSGWPALTVPVGRLAASPRPIGLELLAPAREEASLFALGHILEIA